MKATLFSRHLLAPVALTLPLLAAAQSSVTTYGLVDTMARHASNAGAGGAYVLSDGLYTGSRFGLRGTEDLGGGMRALFTLEMGLSPDTGTVQQATTAAGLGQSVATAGRTWGREAWVALATGLGTVTLGRQYTIAHQLSGRFQPQANPNDAALSVLSGHHVARQDNMIKLNHKVGDVGLVASVTGNEGNGKAWGVGASFTAGPVDVVAYASDMQTNASGADTRKIRGLGGSFAVMQGLKLYLGGMTRSHEVSTQKNKVFTAGLNWNLTEALVFTGSFTDDQQSGSVNGHRKLSFVGLNVFLSRRTDVYTEVDRNQVTGTYAVPAFMAARGSQTGVSFGLRHRF